MSTVYLLPGMGADHAMYSGEWRTLPNSVFLDWPAYRGEKTIAEVAERIVFEHKIAPGSTMVGSSFGGIVACEISRNIQLKNLILIGGAKKSSEINRLLTVLHPLIDLTPLSFVQRAVGRIPNEFLQMFRRAEPEFIRAMCKAIFAWDGLDATAGQPLRIHGNRDRIIPLPAGVQHVLEGGHLLAIHHRAECVNILQDMLAHYP